MYKISTITMNTKLPYDDIELNLYNIWNFLELNETIKGMKFNDNTKGYYKTKSNKKSFYNQINLVVYYNYYVNVKLFGNGSLHFTGCKNVTDGKKITKIILDMLEKLSKKKYKCYFN
jgi:TATA-box binding protein (TBP) (component of TFIID and TFIIIB)